MSRYGLDATLKIEGIEVTQEHRDEALAYTDCEALKCLDEAAQVVGPHFRRYGGTAAAIMEQFIAARGVIEEEMTRCAVRNLESIVTGNRATLRMLNNAKYIEAKEARAAAAKTSEEGPASEPVDPPDPEIEDDTSFLD